MVYTERAPRQQQFQVSISHVTTKQRCKYTTSVDIQNADNAVVKAFLHGSSKYAL